jgi:hypothetical protein
VAVEGVAAGRPVRFTISSSGVRAEGMSWVISSGSAEPVTVQLMVLAVDKLLGGSSPLSSSQISLP